MTAERRERILARAKELGALTYGDFTLSSGEKSTYYFDGRLLSHSRRSVQTAYVSVDPSASSTLR